MILQGLFLCSFQFVLYYFPSVYYGISELTERVPISHLKVLTLRGRDRICMDICRNRDILHTSFVPLL